jgi:hypothetical protein
MSDLTLITKVAQRFAAEAQVMTPEEFEAEVKKHLDIKGRQIRFSSSSLGKKGDYLYINYINLPEGKGGGAESENNRFAVSIEGLTTNKVRAELSVSVNREFKLRAKSGPPAAIAKYVAEYFNKIAKNLEPNFTHTRA